MATSSLASELTSGPGPGVDAGAGEGGVLAGSQEDMREREK